ncbi:hypothetical protein HKX48_009347 [Thoreauomyces humboldtii]|nr:hypothetical protein HKX48_009347 [Thoreauomyces humboldtii]
MVLVQSMQKAGGIRKGVSVVALVTADVSRNRLNQLTKFGVRIDPVTVTSTETTDPTWRDSLTRIEVFKMTEFDRIIVLDVDGTVLKPLDHLFDLPSAPLYAPRAFWLTDQPGFFQSTMYVIEPSVTLYDVQMKLANAPRKNGKVLYDMDIANEAFKNTVSLLPGTLAVLNGQFKANGKSIEGVFGSWTIDELATKASYVHFSEAPMGGCEYFPSVML